MTPTIDVEQFKQWCRDTEPAARAVCLAKAYAQLTRERVDAYIRPIFDGYHFEMKPEWSERLRAGRPTEITDPKDLYLTDLDDPLLAAFYADCDAAHKAHGYTVPTGHCPALRAEHLLSVAENCLIDLAKPLFGIEHVYGEDRKRYLDLLLGACLTTAKERRD